MLSGPHGEPIWIPGPGHYSFDGPITYTTSHAPERQIHRPFKDYGFGWYTDETDFVVTVEIVPAPNVPFRTGPEKRVPIAAGGGDKGTH